MARIVAGVALALYRKYRPATFGEVVGQSHVTEPLRTALAARRINHAYLFSGPRGCGKTSSARILARSLNCVEGPTDEPCGRCDSCVSLGPDGSGSVDVVEMDAASHGGVDDARELRDRAVFAPAQSRYRIFVIDEAHMVTQQGFNALLKIVEEPPDHLVFVFATTEPDKVLTTIRSRTHHYPFRLIPPGELRELLERICAEEGVRVEPAVYPLAIRAGGGSARDALSVLDQLLAGAGDEGITYERAVALLGVTDVALIDSMVDGLAAGDSAAVYDTVNRVVEAGHDPRRFASDLLDRLRDLVLLHSVPDAAERGLIENVGDEAEKMSRQAEQLGVATLTRFAETVHAGLSEMRGATAPRLLLELLCSRMMLPSASSSEAALLQRLERVERRMTVAPPAEQAVPSGVDGGRASAAPAGERAPATGGSAEPAADPREPARERAAESAGPSGDEVRAEADGGQAAPVGGSAGPARETSDLGAGGSAPREEPPSGTATAELRQTWSELLRAVSERNRPTQALLLNASVRELRADTLVISMPTEGLRKQFDRANRVEHVREAMREVLGGEWAIECVVEGEQPASGSAAQQREQHPGASGGPPAGSAPAARERPAEPNGEVTREEKPRERPPESPAPAPEPVEREVPRAAEPTAPVAGAPADSPPEPPLPEEPPPPEAPPPDEDADVDPAHGETPRGEPVADSGAAFAPTPTPVSASASASVPKSAPEPVPEAEPSVEQHDPDELAVELFVSELGARRLDQ
nr:DNA polymerase III subunit gamma and tau [Actinopolyspora biskrensis]